MQTEQISIKARLSNQRKSIDVTITTLPTKFTVFLCDLGLSGRKVEINKE